MIKMHKKSHEMKEKKNHKKQLQGPSLEHTARGQKANENVIKKSKPYPTTKVVE
jgi:hypothetical protein